MSFTLYRVEADYVDPSADVIGPGWVCSTLEEAQALVQELEAREDLTNVKLKMADYGGRGARQSRTRPTPRTSA